MLDQVDFPLKKTQLFEFILENEYSNYFTLQTAIYELTESNFVETTSTHSTTFVNITDAGRDTLKYFQNRMSEGLKKDIATYFADNKMKINNEISVISNYYRTPSGDFVADLAAREKTSELINIKLYMPTEESAEVICEHWKEKNQEIYSYILEHLL